MRRTTALAGLQRCASRGRLWFAASVRHPHHILPPQRHTHGRGPAAARTGAGSRPGAPQRWPMHAPQRRQSTLAEPPPPAAASLGPQADVVQLCSAAQEAQEGLGPRLEAALKAWYDAGGLPRDLGMEDAGAVLRACTLCARSDLARRVWYQLLRPHCAHGEVLHWGVMSQLTTGDIDAALEWLVQAKAVTGCQPRITTYTDLMRYIMEHGTEEQETAFINAICQGVRYVRDNDAEPMLTMLSQRLHGHERAALSIRHLGRLWLSRWVFPEPVLHEIVNFVIETKDHVRASQWVRRMYKRGTPPTLSALRFVATSLAQLPHKQHLFDELLDFAKENGAAHHEAVLSGAIESVVNTHNSTGDPRQAGWYKRLMKLKWVSVWPMEAALAYANMRGFLHVAERVERRAAELGMPLTARAYTLLMSCALRAGDTDAAVEYWRSMEHRNLGLPLEAFEAFAQFHSPPRKVFTRPFSMWKDNRPPVLRPNQRKEGVFVTNLVFPYRNDPSRIVLLMKQMHARNMPVTPVMWKSLIWAHAGDGDVDSASSALAAMRMAKVEPDPFCLVPIMKLHAYKGNIDAFLACYDELAAFTDVKVRAAYNAACECVHYLLATTGETTIRGMSAFEWNEAIVAQTLPVYIGISLMETVIRTSRTTDQVDHWVKMLTNPNVGTVWSTPKRPCTEPHKWPYAVVQALRDKYYQLEDAWQGARYEQVLQERRDASSLEGRDEVVIGVNGSIPDRAMID